MVEKRKIKNYYKIGDRLVAIKTFHLDDIYQKEYYYGIGDEFIIMKIHHQYNNFIEFDLNTKDSVFTWCIDYSELNEFKEFLVREKDYKKFLRKLKLQQLNESKEKGNNSNF